MHSRLTQPRKKLGVKLTSGENVSRKAKSATTRNVETGKDKLDLDVAMHGTDDHDQEESNSNNKVAFSSFEKA